MLQHLQTNKKRVSVSNIQQGGNKGLMSVTWSKNGNHQIFGEGHCKEAKKKKRGNYQKVTDSDFCMLKTPFPADETNWEQRHNQSNSAPLTGKKPFLKHKSKNTTNF